MEGASVSVVRLRIVLLVVGINGLVLFGVVEGLCAGSSITHDRLMPPGRIYHRTGALVVVGSFMSAMLNSWSPFFLPAYFQTAGSSNPARATSAHGHRRRAIRPSSL